MDHLDRKTFFFALLLAVGIILAGTYFLTQAKTLKDKEVPAIQEVLSSAYITDVRSDEEAVRALESGEQNKDVAELLIAKGADVNARTVDGYTPLHQATILGLMDVAELLIAKGADVNAKNKDGTTPIHLASIKAHNEDIAELLIANGADVNAKDKDGLTPLAYAKKIRNGGVVEVIRRHGGK